MRQSSLWLISRVFFKLIGQVSRMRKIGLAVLIAGVIVSFGAVLGLTELKRFSFNRENALKEWKEKIFHGRVLYTVTPRDPAGYLTGKSRKASSGLFYLIKFSPKKYPYLSWRWKVDKFPSKSRENDRSRKSWIERDDYAVRFYVIFPAMIFTNTRCLEYVWSEDLPQGAILTSPFFKNIKLIVLESGKERMGEWIQEERNVFEDYRAAFGRFPSGTVGAIALMTDSDNTQSDAEGGYSDIKVGYEKAAIESIPEKEIVKGGPSRASEFLEYLKQFFKSK